MFRLLNCLTLLLALLCIGGLAAPLDSPTTTTTTSLRQDRGGLIRRQSVVQGTVCANVPIRVTVLGAPYTIIDGICLCTEAGVLTPDSVARLDAQIIAQNSVVGSVVQTVVNLLGGVTRLLGLAREAGTGAVTNSPATCAYPANSTPQCPGTAGASTLPGTSCSFTCDANFRQCGTSFCIASTQQCISGLPARRSLSLSLSSDTACPRGMEPCYLADRASLALGNSVPWECVDTARDMESCGGCRWPVSGEAGGRDCTALDGVDGVSCIDGQCRASSCMRGFQLNGTECIEASVKGFWRAF